MNAPIRMDPDAWRAGYLAGQRREPVNPYPAGDTKGLAWASGYIEGKANPEPPQSPITTRN